MSKYSNEFQERMENHLIIFKEENQYLLSKSEKKRFLYSDLSDNFYPSLKHGLLQYIYENGIPLHDYANHVRSSQAFAFNLLRSQWFNTPQLAAAENSSIMVG